MATATKRVRAPSHGARAATGITESPRMEFLVYKDNGGDYHWSIVSAGGATLVESGSFGCYDDAQRAARRVRDGAGSALFAPRLADEDLLATV
jgi:uncharacterized protein YegP (UPF0339 family)